MTAMWEPAWGLPGEASTTTWAPPAVVGAFTGLAGRNSPDSLDLEVRS